MKDLGELHHFLGMHVRRCGPGLLLSQRQYMLDILERAGMTECKPCSTPVDTNPKLAADGSPVQDASEFQSLAGALQYLTFTRPDIATQFSRFACTCMILASHTLLLSSISSATSKGLCTWGSFFGHLHRAS